MGQYKSNLRKETGGQLRRVLLAGCYDEWGGVYLLTEKSMLMGRSSSPENVHDRKDRQKEGVAMSFQRFYGNTLNIKPVLHWEECTIFRRHVMQGEDSRQEMGPGPSVSMRVKIQKPKARPRYLRTLVVIFINDS